MKKQKFHSKIIGFGMEWKNSFDIVLKIKVNCR
jgi:hypothetical protein